jgi:phosphoribosylaminoimidazole (AIR) synthetase
MQVSGTSLHDTAPWSGESFGLTLLTPTVIYVRDCMKLVAAADIRGLVHMTGGGFPENIPRVVPKGLAARVQRSAWEVPPLFQWLQEVGVRELWVAWEVQAASTAGWLSHLPGLCVGLDGAS